MKDRSDMRAYAVSKGYMVEIHRRGRWTDYLLENERVKFNVAVHSQDGRKQSMVHAISGDVRFPDLKYGWKGIGRLAADIEAAKAVIDLNVCD